MTPASALLIDQYSRGASVDCDGMRRCRAFRADESC